MSDDTPTERFDPIDKPDEAPTLRLPAAPGEAPAAPTTPIPGSAPAAATVPAAKSTPTPAPQSWTSGPSRPRRAPGSRAPFVAFMILAILVVAAIVVLVVVLVSNASPSAAPASTGSASAATSTPPTQSAPSNPAPTAPAPPPAPAGSFTAFVAQPQQTGCFGGHGRGGQSAPVQVSWATQNAVSVWVAAGTADAADAGTMQIPASGNQSNFPQPLLYDCSQASNTFTMTLVDANGAHVSKTWTVTLRGRHR